MNYRHGFHAGNHADVLKHLVLVALLDSFKRKEAGFFAIDSHAGRGRYDLEFSHYEPVPGGVQARLVASYRPHDADD